MLALEGEVSPERDQAEAVWERDRDQVEVALRETLATPVLAAVSPASDRVAFPAARAVA